MATLRRVLLFSRDVERAAAWYAALGLRVSALSLPSYARLEGGGGLAIDLQHTDSEAAMSVGYGPLLCFSVPGGLDALVPALLAAGGRLDGAIAHSELAQVACLRSPDGHLCSIIEEAEVAEAAAAAGPLR